MNKLLKYTFACAITTAGLFQTTTARADIYNEQYLGIQAAIVNVTNHTNLSDGVSVVGTYGVVIPQIHDYFSVELEYTQSVDNPEHNTPTSHTEFEYYTVAGYAVMTVPIHERISLRGRAGALYEHWEYRNNLTGQQEHSDSDLSIGGGAIYKLNTDMNLIAEITIIESDIVHASAGMQFKF